MKTKHQYVLLPPLYFFSEHLNVRFFFFLHLLVLVKSFLYFIYKIGYRKFLLESPPCKKYKVKKVTIFLKSSHLKIRVLLLSYWSLLQLGIVFFVGLCQIMVFNATFNNISVISWQSLLLVKETEVPGENHRSVATLSHNVAIHEQGSNSQL